MGWQVERLAQWWAQASEESRFALLAKATKENSPPLAEVHLAAYLAEIDQGTVSQG